jgi:hypothetical protein
MLLDQLPFDHPAVYLLSLCFPITLITNPKNSKCCYSRNARYLEILEKPLGYLGLFAVGYSKSSCVSFSYWQLLQKTALSRINRGYCKRCGIEDITSPASAVQNSADIGSQPCTGPRCEPSNHRFQRVRTWKRRPAERTAAVAAGRYDDLTGELVHQEHAHVLGEAELERLADVRLVEYALSYFGHGDTLGLRDGSKPQSYAVGLLVLRLLLLLGGVIQ